MKKWYKEGAIFEPKYFGSRDFRALFLEIFRSTTPGKVWVRMCLAVPALLAWASPVDPLLFITSNNIRSSVGGRGGGLRRLGVSFCRTRRKDVALRMHSDLAIGHCGHPRQQSLCPLACIWFHVQPVHALRLIFLAEEIRKCSRHGRAPCSRNNAPLQHNSSRPHSRRLASTHFLPPFSISVKWSALVMCREAKESIVRLICSWTH